MSLGRCLDDRLASLYRGGKIHGGVYTGRGQEALSAALGHSLKKGDILAPLIRDTAGRLAFGEPVLDAVRTYLGSAQGPMRARDGNVHRGRPQEGLLPMISHLGAMIAVVNGMLMARRMKGESGSVGAASLGDGGTSTGAFHEALNQAAVEKLPLVLVIADNQYAYSTPTYKQFACASLVDRAPGYGVKGFSVDGTDLRACLEVLGKAVDDAREGGGPQLVVAKLLRLGGHGEHDDAAYVDQNLRKKQVGRDCLAVAKRQLIQQGWADASQIEAWHKDSLRLIDEAIAIAQRDAAIDPYQEKWCALATAHLGEARSTT